MEEYVILVDSQDRPIGTMEKLAAHQEGRLHRAFSVFVLNGSDEMLLQRRAETKYHSGGLWTNACDGHPRPGEEVVAAAHRRLQEELGFDCPLAEVFRFTYRVEIDHGLTEHEIDYVLVGRFEGQPQPNPQEASECRWASWDEVSQGMKANPEQYAEWFKIAFENTTWAALAGYQAG